MTLSLLDDIELPASADFHVHLRDGDMARLVTPTIRRGGVDTVFVMPNLVPPLTTVDQVLAYRDRLRAIDPTVNYLMSLYLHPSITPEVVRAAAAAGITGIKSYPAGVTTNSASGVVDYTQFYPVFEAMQDTNMVLNLHGERPSGGPSRTTILSAEEEFLPTLLELHAKFPRLRIILEHCTTAAAVDAVAHCGPTVSGTITAHHLFIVVDDWAADPFCFCKPVAKTPADRDALIRAVVSGNSKFFFGSDSAPHPVTSKRGGDSVAAGVFTQPYTTQLVLAALELAVENGVIKEADITREKLEGFLSSYGREFYGLQDNPPPKRIRLQRGGATIEDTLKLEGSGIEVVPFRRKQLCHSLQWL